MTSTTFLDVLFSEWWKQVRLVSWPSPHPVVNDFPKIVCPMWFNFYNKPAWLKLTFNLYLYQFQPSDKKDISETFSEPVKLICPSEVR